jgi:hypothetical protein
VAEPVSGTARLIEDYLGSTLGSLIKAQGMLASQLAEFVERVGFEPGDGDDAPLQARMFSFAFERTEVGEDDELVTRRVTASLPLLSIVSLPALAIDSADIHMDLRIVATEAPPETPPPGPVPPGPRPPVVLPPVRPPLALWTIPVRPPPPPPPGQPPRPDPATVGSIRVSVTLRRLDLPLGLERVERLLTEGYREEVEEA